METIEKIIEIKGEWMEEYIGKNDSIRLYNGDCLEVMDMLIAEGVKVDAIITDEPYLHVKGGIC